ncbi:hypothetical protein SAMN05444680_103488 [Variovorax sp. YR216]|nr:hypothetical protein SAMN05444680_103488 [Variovorax sp. YR216]
MNTDQIRTKRAAKAFAAVRGFADAITFAPGQ